MSYTNNRYRIRDDNRLRKPKVVLELRDDALDVAATQALVSIRQHRETDCNIRRLD
jgi:hypothetical protein